MTRSNREPGISCPGCGCFIPTTITELLVTQTLICYSCGLELKMDRKASSKALGLLQKVNHAQQMVDEKSKFHR
ncbi:MAG: hypothetical protein LBK47_06870 [Prevotellaceae bacterium]|jgi:hypothetical protein|nr:hypothetical protein [Prevotellaceae bacterium]